MTTLCDLPGGASAVNVSLPQLAEGEAPGHGIEWLNRPGTVGRTWNPLAGCTKVAPGCKHCYAMVMARRIACAAISAQARGKTLTPKQRAYMAVVKRDKDDGAPLAEWNNKVVLIPEALTEPLKWKKPATVFMSMTDLFHEEVPFEYIDRVLAVMALTPRHTYLILTKRPERATEYFADGPGDLGACGPDKPASPQARRPPTNLWLGCSVSDQKTADEAIPHLLRCPAAVRFVSYEPALGPVDFTKLNLGNGDVGDCLNHRASDIWTGAGNKDRPWGRIHWLIVGGESGPGARPTDIAWHRSARDQCKAAGVAFFEKQLGKRPVQDSGDSFSTFIRWANKGATHIWRDDVCFDARGRVCDIGVRIYRPLSLRDKKGGDWSEWPEDMRVREWPNGGASR